MPMFLQAFVVCLYDHGRAPREVDSHGSSGNATESLVGLLGGLVTAGPFAAIVIDVTG